MTTHRMTITFSAPSNWPGNDYNELESRIVEAIRYDPVCEDVIIETTHPALI